MKKLWETLKTMSFKEAVDYIWEYYKLHIIGIAFGVFVLGSILSNVFKEDEELYNVMVVGGASYDTIEIFSEELNQQYFDDFRVAVDNIIHGGGDLSNQSYAQVQKLVAKISTGMVDIMVTDKDFATDLVDQEGITSFDQVIDVERLEQNNVELYKLDSGEIYGIGTNQLAIFREIEAFQDLIIIIPATSKNTEKTSEVLDVLLES